MCITFLVTNPLPKIKLLLLFNRDEIVKRPTLNLSKWGGVLSGLDVQSQGTWLGINFQTLNFGLITNYAYKNFFPTAPEYKRGPLVSNFLGHAEA